jgi:hypothetical protein
MMVSATELFSTVARLMLLQAALCPYGRGCSQQPREFVRSQYRSRDDAIGRHVNDSTSIACAANQLEDGLDGCSQRAAANLHPMSVPGVDPALGGEQV